MFLGRATLGLALAVCCCIPSQSLFGQSRQTSTVQSATQVVQQIMSVPNRRIPAALLANAKGIVIVPSLIKGGFVVGVRHGFGVLLLRDGTGQWRAPYFLRLTGGSVGFQAGLQATDVILVFKTQRSVQGLLNGKFTIGVDAAAAAGPVGRQAAAATDGKLAAEIYSYSRSRGLFAGVSVDGSVLEIDHPMTSAYYMNPATAPNLSVPPEATQLVQVVAGYSQVKKADPTAVPVTPMPTLPVASVPAKPTPPQMVVQSPDALRRQLASASRTLQTLLDENWKTYLAVPAEVYNIGSHPTPASIASILNRYDTIAQGAQYQVLNQRAEFQNVHQLLKQYAKAIEPRNSPTLTLPPPPK